jgi:deoxycytidylate deaminase
MQRSICAVQVGAVLVDDYGIFSWGWNSVGDGFGEHAEVSCLRRANLKRQPGSTLFVASQRRKHGKAITSKPCEKCQGWIEARGIEEVWWRGGDGLWHLL